MFFNETQRHEDTKIKTKIYEKIRDPPHPLPFGDLCHDSAMPK